MKNKYKYIYKAASLLIASAAIQSCSMEAPFSSEEGVLQMKLVINSNVTRAEMSEQYLADNCVVYISNEKGLVFKEKGLNNIPDQIVLRQGSYIAEAWTGDSVPASFDSKFYRCYEPIEIVGGTNEIQLTCKIANVVTSVNANSIDDTQVKNLRVTVSSSNGSLEFTSDNFKTGDNPTKGYFMMPYDEDGNRESVLTIEIEGENILNEPFTKTKKVENAKPGYEYIVNLSYDDTGDEPNGGGYLVVQIDERENLVASTVEIFGAPSIEGADFDIEKQIVGNPGEFVGDKTVKVIAFDEITSFIIECVDAGNLNLPAQAVDLKHCDDATIAQINAAGITWDKEVYPVESNKDGHTRQLSYITFSEAYLNNLPARDTEYRIELSATDGNGKTTTRTVRIAVGEDAIVHDVPIIADNLENAENVMAVGARSATLTLTVDSEATNPGVRYRESGVEEWTTVALTRSRASSKSTLTLKNLKPGTRYEYQAIADGYTPSESLYFTTEGIFEIPNASLEEWSSYSKDSKILLPGAGGERTFWDTGNHGSSTMDVTLTQGSEDMKHSGNLSAKLRSQFVGVGAIGKFAAGNLFAGTYVKTDGMDGVIEFGRPYNGSHPTKLRVYVNYRPGKVEKKGDYLAVGAEDIGQIYIALTTDPIEVKTKKSERKLFPTKADDPDFDKLVAYGQYTFEGNYGPDGELKSLEIPFEYFSNAKSVKPTHLVIVCSASKYGDYFNGGEGSTMYVDDFELVYE